MVDPCGMVASMIGATTEAEETMGRRLGVLLAKDRQPEPHLLATRNATAKLPVWDRWLAGRPWSLLPLTQIDDARSSRHSLSQVPSPAGSFDL